MMRVVLAALCFVLFSLPVHAYWTTDASGSGGTVRSHGSARKVRLIHHYQHHPEISRHAQNSLGICAEAAR